jgi:hypothetical protein
LSSNKPAINDERDLLNEIDDILLRQVSPDKLNWWTLRRLKRQILKIRQ